MATETDQVKALQQAIVERAQQLAEGHKHQGQMTRHKIIEDMRDKIKVMEQKELLAAKVNADREYQRRVQASELRIQAELDRNRWGLVQSVMNHVKKELEQLQQDEERYSRLFRQLMQNGVQALGQKEMIAEVNSDDLARYAGEWDGLVTQCCGDGYSIQLAPEASACSGGLKLMSRDGDRMVDNTFEGILARQDEALQRVIFERLFSTVSGMGTMLNG